MGRVLISTKIVKEHHVCCALAIREELLKNNEEAVQELVNSLVMSGEFVQNHPREASEIGAEFLGQTQHAVYSALTAEGGRATFWDLLPNRGEFEEVQDYALNKVRMSFKKIDILELVEPSYAEKAREYLAATHGERIKQENLAQKFILPLALLALFLATWYAIAISGRFSQNLLPSPLDVLSALGELYANGNLFMHVTASLSKVFIGFTIAALLAIPTGLVVGWYKYAYYGLEPLIQMIRTVSPIAWIPLAILWFGIGDPPAVFIIIITTFFPILISTIQAIKNLDPVLVKTAMNFGAKDYSMLLKIVLPASLPYVFLGLRIALGISWVVIVAAEMVGMQSGLGYLILDARNLLRTDMVIAGMVTIGAIGFTLDWIMNWIEKRVLKYRVVVVDR